MLYSEQECMVSTSKTGVCVCALLQCMAGRAEAQHSASPSLLDEPRRRPASLKHSLLRSPAEDPAGPDTQENAAHQKQGQVVHSQSVATGQAMVMQPFMHTIPTRSGLCPQTCADIYRVQSALLLGGAQPLAVVSSLGTVLPFRYISHCTPVQWGVRVHCF